MRSYYLLINIFDKPKVVHTLLMQASANISPGTEKSHRGCDHNLTSDKPTRVLGWPFLVRKVHPVLRPALSPLRSHESPLKAGWGSWQPQPHLVD